MFLILLPAARCVTAREGGSQGLIREAGSPLVLSILRCPALQSQPTRDSHEHQWLHTVQPACLPGSGQMPPAL